MCMCILTDIQIVESGDGETVTEKSNNKQSFKQEPVKNMEEILINDALKRVFCNIVSVNLTRNNCVFLYDDGTMKPINFHAKKVEELLDISLDTIPVAKDRVEFLTKFNRAAQLEAFERGEREITVCLRRLQKDGKTLWMETKNVLSQNRTGDIYSVAFTRSVDSEMRKTEELRIAKEKAELDDKSKTDFIFNMSHDLRTPLNAMLGFTELSMKMIDDKEKVLQYIQNIHKSGNQLLAIINNVLEMARIESGKIVIEEEQVDVVKERRRLVGMFERELKEKQLSLTTDFEIVHPDLYEDTVHMEEIFFNVISNAVKYTLSGGKIRFAIREYPGMTDNTCVLESTIEDTGIGMSKEFLEHIYDNFARESNALDVQGVGLGLGIVKKLVELLNGTLSIESKLGVGTKVTISMPHRIVKDVVSKQTPMDESVFERKRILLAEDNELNAEIAMEILQSVGIQVDRVADGRDCVEKMEQTQAGVYDLILMDVQMPNMDGCEATEAIRKFKDPAKAKIPIFAMTANAFVEDKERVMEAGMNGHITKPISIRKLLEMLQDILL